MSATDGHPLLTYLEAGELLGGLSLSSVKRLVAVGDLPSVRVGPKLRRIRRVDLDRYVADLGGDPSPGEIPPSFLGALPPYRGRRA